jgi:hypothetical protein
MQLLDRRLGEVQCDEETCPTSARNMTAFQFSILTGGVGLEGSGYIMQEFQ